MYTLRWVPRIGDPDTLQMIAESDGTGLLDGLMVPERNFPLSVRGWVNEDPDSNADLESLALLARLVGTEHLMDMMRSLAAGDWEE